MENLEFSQIYKFFLNSISNDYRIRKQFEEAPEVATEMLELWLIKAIGFIQPRLNIEDLESKVDLENKCISGKISFAMLTILVNGLILMWQSWNINNITQMNYTLNDNDFKHYSEERNLIAKQSCYAQQREILCQEIVDYNSFYTNNEQG